MTKNVNGMKLPEPLTPILDHVPTWSVQVEKERNASQEIQNTLNNILLMIQDYLPCHGGNEDIRKVLKLS